MLIDSRKNGCFSYDYSRPWILCPLHRHMSTKPAAVPEWPFNILSSSLKLPIVIKRFITFTIITVVVFSAAYYALMEESIKYTQVINRDTTKLLDSKKSPSKLNVSLSAPASWLYLGDSKELDESKTRHDLISAFYFSLSIQATLGPPHYPPNQAWKLLTGVHIIFVIVGMVLQIV